MPRIIAFAVHAVDLPFRVKFRHAAAVRSRSESVFVELQLDDHTVGWGESLPRPYVTGESRDAACSLLAETILPRLLDRPFGSFDEVIGFLTECNGRAPADWVPMETPQSAAWCAVDLALLDAFGRSFRESPWQGGVRPAGLRYSGVVSAGARWKYDAQLFAYKWLGLRQLKLKIDASTSIADMARIRQRAGSRADIRVDVNMAWDVEHALASMPAFAHQGVRCFEQPLPADDLQGAARLVRETGLEVMADESLNTADSLQRLIAAKACTAINARISKCGGLVATLARCREAQQAGLWLQVGCQVGESSLLSAAQLHLCAALKEVRYAEGCFGSLLLKDDPVRPRLRMKYGGRPPARPVTPGLGVVIDQQCLQRYRSGHWWGGEPMS